MLGLEIKSSKNASRTVIEFLGLVIDTAKMEARLPAEKKDRALLLISELTKRNSCSLLDLQRLTGLLNFLSKVIPLGRTLCQQLYDLEQRFTAGGGKHVLRRIPSAARKDLRWWRDLLPNHNGILIIQPHRPWWRLWTDAAGKKCIGGFILPGYGPSISGYHEVTEFFSARVLFSQRNEHINVKEMVAVHRAFKKWGLLPAGCHLVIFCNNTAVVSSLRHRTTRGRLIDPEGRFMLLLLPATKTDPFRLGMTITITHSPHNPLCAVKLMATYLQNTSPANPRCPLYVSLGGTPFSRVYLIQEVQRLALANSIAGNFTGHSFRHGAATWASRQGLGTDQIPKLGRGKSAAYQLYIDTTEQDKQALSRRFISTGSIPTL